MSRNSRRKNQLRKKQKPRPRRLSSPRSLYAPHVPDVELVATDADLEQPDQLKFKYATFVSDRSPGREKRRDFEAAVKRGRLGQIPEIDHWAMEEFFWHGVPGDDWNPMEAYLDFVGDRISGETKQALQQWQRAELGLWHIEGVADDTLVLCPWDVETMQPEGEAIRAVSLGMGGAQFFADGQGKLLVGYLAPWQPNLHCFMGFGAAFEPDKVGPFALLLGLRRPDLMAEPLPWKATPPALKQYLKSWKQRDWRAWLSERLAFPFQAVVLVGSSKRFRIQTVQRLVSSSTAVTDDFGVYFEVPLGEGEVQVTGATAIVPLDVTSDTWLALEEYRIYRDHIGPPKGIPAGASTFTFDRSGGARWR